MTAIVFDLDGTLVDSAPDLHAAAAKLLAEEKLPPLSLDLIRSFIGNGVPKLVERLAAAAKMDLCPEQLEAMTQRFMGHYMAAPADLTACFQGVPSALAALRSAGHRLAVCTNKPVAPARAILDSFGLSRSIDGLIGGDSLPVKKPDPAPLQAAFDLLGASSGIYVGDSEVDAATAAAARVPFLLYTEGYRKAPLAALPSQGQFGDFSALPALVRALPEQAA